MYEGVLAVGCAYDDDELLVIKSQCCRLIILSCRKRLLSILNSVEIIRTFEVMSMMLITS
jgi:hypothetical protein